LRARADSAERFAKGDGTGTPRNALAIQLGIRSGAETLWRCRWNEGNGKPQNCEGVQAMQQFIAEYRAKKCPSRLGYDLRAIALRLEWVEKNGNKLPGIHAAELARTLSRARQRGGEGELTKEFKVFIEARAKTIGLARLADELIITRWLSARTQSDIGSLE
jgi:CRISPR-associated protein Cmr2